MPMWAMPMLFLAACSSLSDADYTGNPYVQVRANAPFLADASADDQLYATILWLNYSGTPDSVHTQVISDVVTDDSPQLKIRAVPALSAMNRLDFGTECSSNVQEVLVRQAQRLPSTDTTSCSLTRLPLASELSYVIAYAENHNVADAPSAEDYKKFEPARAQTLKQLLGDVENLQSDPERLEMVRMCYRMAFNLGCYPYLAGKALGGYVGVGYIAVYKDGDGDGQLTIAPDNETVTPDAAVGGAPSHLFVYFHDIGDGTLQWIREQEFLFTNPDAISPGYHLARFVCADGHDKVELVANESVDLWSSEELKQKKDQLCQDFF